jgi:enolase
MSKITAIKAREILDSRGDPAVEVELKTERTTTIASVPSGASVGSHEAVELRDNDKERYGGLGVLKAVENVNSTIAKALIGLDCTKQSEVDKALVILDGTAHKSALGANAILAVSIAVCKAAAIENDLPLYQYIGRLSSVNKFLIPTPMFNFIEGAKHAANNLAIQEFLSVYDQEKFSDSLRYASESFHSLGRIMKQKMLGNGVGFEGGYAPNHLSDAAALSLLVECGCRKLALDMAGVVPNGLTVDSIVANYPIISLEDPIEEDDWDGWTEVTAKHGSKIMIVGDDVFASNSDRLREGVKRRAANAVIIKPNQVGTVTEAIEFTNLARENSYKLVVSHRSGETEDSFIADFAVGVGADFVKFGAPSRGERIVKYNRLLRIEEGLA